MLKAGRRRINLALQGGGAHGAFTWGVLEGLLQDGSLSFAWLSGTSAGAVNAAALASGLATGDAGAALETLRLVWDAVEAAGVPDLMSMSPFFFGLSPPSSVPDISGLFSPYHFNPLGFDPLRRLLTKHIDFERIRTSAPVELLIAATDVMTGRARLFRRNELTVEAVLASACLPTLHHAVVIDGRPYWDGGFSANPDIVTLASESPVEDTLIVQLNPLQETKLPRSAREIADRVNEITFNQPFLRDIEAIVSAKNEPAGWFSGRHYGRARLKRHRFHVIEAGPYTAGLSADTKLKPDKKLLTFLHDAGLAEAKTWLRLHSASVGRQSTVDLRHRYLSQPPVQLAKVPVNGEQRAASPGG